MVTPLLPLKVTFPLANISSLFFEYLILSEVNISFDLESVILTDFSASIIFSFLSYVALSASIIIPS